METTQIQSTFRQNVESVHRLMEFDHVLLDFCSDKFAKLADRLKKAGIDNAITESANRSLEQLTRVRDNESLRLQYAEIFNQSLVLLVSYFGLTVRDLFKAGFINALQSGNLGKLQRQELKIPLQELQLPGGDLADRLADMFVAQKDISFQDMQSISRSFHDCFGHKPDRDMNVNNIIVAQACRHVIVHSGARADLKLLNQVAGANPRELKECLADGEKIQFQPNEIRLVGQSMIVYVNGLCAGLNKNS
jgi:hypothetical protein